MRNISKTNKPSKREIYYFRQRQKNRIFQGVAARFAELAEKEGLTQKELALRTKKDKAVVNRLLSGPGNWTLETLSDLLLAMGSEMSLEVVPFIAEQPSMKNLLIYNTFELTRPLAKTRIGFQYEQKEARLPSVA